MAGVKWLDVERVEELAAAGLTEGQIARQLGVCQDTFTKRKKDQDGVVEALARGRKKAIGTIENVAFQAAMKAGDDPRYQTSMIFWLKCQAGWKERQVIEVEDGRERSTREDLMERVEYLARRAGSAAAEA